MMILISNGNVEQVQKSMLSELERNVLQKKEKSPATYSYDSPDALIYELKMRSRIVEAAKSLNASGARFATFKDSRCNEQLWSRLDNGGFQLRNGILPSDGIEDILRNGHLYAFECSTAMVIVLYKAMIDMIAKPSFNAYFGDLVLYAWDYNENLRLITTNNINEAYVGDVLYFENPDHAREMPEWQGENAIMMPNNLYYGHGIGIQPSGIIIASLNRKRKPGSTTSAFLSEQAVHPDFEYVRKLSARGNELEIQYEHLDSAIIAKIGMNVYSA